MSLSERKYFTSERLAQRQRNYGAVVFVQLDIGVIIGVGDLRHQQPAGAQHVVHSQAQIDLAIAAGKEEGKVLSAARAPLVGQKATQYPGCAHRRPTAE